MFRLTLLLLLSLVLTTANASSYLIKNVQGYSVNQGELVQFHAIKFTNEKIDKLYSAQDIAAADADVIVIDGEGKTLLPGLIDAHGHVLNYGLFLMRVDLNGTKSEQAAVEKAHQFWQDNKEVSWLLGRGWNQSRWPSNEFPTAASLDEYFKDIPVWFKRVDGHAGWANSKAMAMAGITAETLSPEGGQIIKDKDGKPTGVFIDNAMDLIVNKIPALSQVQIEAALTKAMQALAADGITSVHDAGVDGTVIQAFENLSKLDKLPIRVNVMLSATASEAESLLKRGTKVSANHKYQLNSVKISSDGALGSRGAAMIMPYSDQTDHKGLLLHREENLEKLIEVAMQHGFQVNTHAIGDYANKIVLDLYEKLIAKTDSRQLRHRVEHAQILRLEDIPRFAELGVIASMQSTHATSDKNMAEDRIGPERIAGAYAWRSLLDSGAIIASGSDFPVESANPFFGLHAAITRQDQQNQPELGWYAKQKMSKTEALKSFTFDAAYAAHQEKFIGSLEPDKLADFIVIDKNIMTGDERQIWQTKVLQTWVHGKRVH